MYTTETLGFQIPELDDTYDIGYVKVNAQLMEKAINDVNDKIADIKTSNGGIIFGISDNNCLTVTYDDGTE